MSKDTRGKNRYFRSIKKDAKLLKMLTDVETGKTIGNSLPEGIYCEGNQYTCILCNVTTTSPQFESHLKGKRHRYEVLLANMKVNRDRLVSNKKGITVTCQFDTESKPGYVCFNGKEIKEITLKVKNNNKFPVVLHTCEKLKNSKFYVISRRIDHHLQQDEIYEIPIKFRGRAPGFYVIPIALTFTLSDETARFFIVRCLSAKRDNDLIQSLQPTTPYQKLSVPCQTVRLRKFDGYPLNNSNNSKLEIEIPLQSYEVPDHVTRLLGSEEACTEELDSIRGVLHNCLSKENYTDKFNFLLYIEETQMKVDIQQYDMQNVTMTNCKENPRLLVLKVPGLLEKRPSVLKGDHLYVTIGEDHHNEYEGCVHNVCREEVWLGFNDALMRKNLPNTKFSVRFVINRLPLRLQHRAVTLADEHSLSPLLFPSAEAACKQLPSWNLEQQLKLYDRRMESNPSQLQAVKHILSGTSRPVPYLVFGPPGTGKTVTIVEAMKQIWKLLPSSHILACAPSNSAADLLLERLVSHVDTNQIIRLNAPSRLYATVPEKIRKYCNYQDSEIYFPPKKDLQQYRIIVCTLITAGRLVSANFPAGHFSHVFIDEAGQATEPESVIPLAGIMDTDNHCLQAGQVVLTGDPEQLGPLLRSRVTIQFGLDISLLERLMKQSDIYKKTAETYDERLITKLVYNYRSHPVLLDQPNKLFYHNELVAKADECITKCLCKWHKLAKKKFPLIFHGVIGDEKREEKSPSFFNPHEVEQVHYYVKELLDVKFINQKDVGVITPYRKQVEKIRKVLKTYPDVEVGSVEQFQGREKLAIIISTVRSNPDYLALDVKCDLGFVRNQKRLNVAITRAKALLIIIGNPHILARDRNWKSILQYCQMNGAYTGCEFEEELPDDMFETLQKLTLDEVPAEHDASETSLADDVPWREDP